MRGDSIALQAATTFALAGDEARTANAALGAALAVAEPDNRTAFPLAEIPKYGPASKHEPRQILHVEHHT